MSDQSKARELLDRSKLPSREREIKEYRFRNRLHQAIGLARTRLQQRQVLAKSASDQPDASKQAPL